MAKANIYFEQRNYDAALYQVYLVRYTDPSIEAAYELEWQIGVDRNRPGEASQAAQDYLYYYPGATRAYRLLGEAYELEGKPDLALAVYNRGLSGRTTDSDTVGMLASRAEIFRRLGESESAIEDYTRLFEITNDPSYRLGRMQTAVEIGRFADALEDAEALAGSPNVPQGLVNLVRGRAIVESADEGDRALFQQAAEFLDQAVISPDLADPDLRGLALEYLARAQYELDSTESALETIQSALDIAETGSRRYWRGRINEAENNDDAAALDYEFVLTWSQVYAYPFRVDAEERLNALRE
jgi:tetratricopeptide (TPR) repeat protein